MELVSAALEQSPETRERYLRSACDSYPDLFPEVEERVQWEHRMGGFLCQTVVESLDLLDRPFEPGELVAGRFRVLNEVGRGGMGVVYEAYDEKLARHVALKTAVRGHDNRLPPEARAAREVSHFNVCKVHELHTTRSELGEVDFLTMEFIPGETLSARIRRTGPLPVKQARDIAGQICAGLAQAHRQGVIHGDLKCGNVILTEMPEGGTRAVITDFGLASLNLAAGETGSTMQLRGSFDYMAPELFSGTRPSIASDVYALGVMLHEMLTGKLPDPVRAPSLPEGATTLTLSGGGHRRPFANRRCQKLARPWAAIVASCLEFAPEDRFASADEVIERLEKPPKKRGWLLAGAAAAVLLAAVLWLGREGPGPPVRLAVLPIVVEGSPVPAAAGVGVELTDRLSGARRNFVVIPPGEAQRNRVDTLEKAKTVLTATHVLRARIRSSRGQMVVQASIIETRSSLTLQELRGTYPANGIALVAKALTATVTGAFRLRVPVPLEVLAAAAYPYYVQGLSLLRRDDLSTDEAMRFFQKAIELDPRSALPYAALAEAEVQKFKRGFGAEWLDRAAQSAARAQSLNPDSVPVLRAAGLYKQQHGWYEEAAQNFGRALELAPNDADVLNGLAEAYADLNRAKMAIETYQKAIQAQPDYYAPYIEFGRFYRRRGQFQEAEKLFRHAALVAPGLALAYRQLGLALNDQKRFPEAKQSWLKALDLQRTALVLTDLGGLYYQEERYPEALRYFQESLQSDPPSAVQYLDLGDAYRHVGLSSQADEVYRRAQELAELDLSQNPKDPIARTSLAYSLAELGDRSRAEFEITQALTLNPLDAGVIREAVFTFEALRAREKALQVLGNARAPLLEELSRQPDMRDLQADPQFQELLRNKMSQP